MKQKYQPSEFGKNAASPFEGDLLNREEEIKALTPMIKTIASPAVMALDAPWGTGKTAFAKMWSAHLNGNEGIPSLYFNAWETDFAVDPLAPFMEKIKEQLPGHGEFKIMEHAKELIPLVVHDVASKLAGDTLACVVKKTTEKLFTHHSKIAAFKKALEDYAASTSAKRIVVFVDELDRCRPDYAVKVLERIKHLFEVPGLIFVLAINSEQLRNSVNALYGDKLDAGVYLRRFVEFDFPMNKPSMHKFLGDRFDKLGMNKFLQGRNIISEFQYDKEKLVETLELLARLYDSSLRDVEQLLTRIVLVLYSLEEEKERKSRFYPVLLSFLVLARQQTPDLYNKYIIPRDDGEEIVAAWEGKLENARVYDEGGEGSSIAAYTTAHILIAKYHAQKDMADAPPLSDFIRRHEERITNARTTGERRYRQELAKHLQTLGEDFRREINLSYLIKKVEMLDKFRFSHLDGNKGDDSEENS